MHLSNLHFESLLLRLVSGTVRINDGEIENSQGHTASCTRNPGITDSLAHSLFLYINIHVYNICLNYSKFMYMLSDKAFGEMNLGAGSNIEFHLAFICASLNYFQLLELQQTLLLYNKQT